MTQPKTFDIVVNGRNKQVTGDTISFDEVVKLAYPDTPPTETLMFTVSYRRGQGDKPEGELVEGQSVKLKEGMIFNVTPTNRS